MSVFDVLREKFMKAKQKESARNLIANQLWMKAIEIVNQVEAEYDDDFCEWKLEKDIFIQNPHTRRKFSNEPSMKNVYCNTCGKKIMVMKC